jgi:hypothetical protein
MVVSEDPLVTVQGVAELTGLTERQVRAAVTAETLTPEARVGVTPVWRTSTIKRWDSNGRKGMPLSPSLDVLGQKELAERWHVSGHLIHKWRTDGILPEPDHIPKALVWELATIQAIDPICDGCGQRIDAVASEHENGKPVQLKCSCGRWSPMRLRADDRA